jgi:hypothetical protein
MHRRIRGSRVSQVILISGGLHVLIHRFDPQEVYGSDFPWGGETFRVLTKSPSFASSYPAQSAGDALGDCILAQCPGSVIAFARTLRKCSGQAAG